MPALAKNDYDFLRHLVYERSRINLGPDKQELVARRVQKRVKALGLRDISDYCSRLRGPTASDELVHLMDAISTNVTQFFRENQHFDFVIQTVLPQWTQNSSRRRGTFAAWSAACSSGEEPYTIAMVLEGYFASQPQNNWRVEATDISTRMLDHARAGVYEASKVQLPDPALLRRHFQKGQGAYSGYYRVKPNLRERVRFHHANLFECQPPDPGAFDLIFCRNVMIYFDRQAQEDLIGKLAGALVPGGYLIVGHSESLINLKHPLRGVRPSVYLKPA